MCAHSHSTTVRFSSSNLLFIGGRGSSCRFTLFPRLSKKLPTEKHTHCAHLPPVHTHPTSVPLRLINKSKILPALLSQITICSLWDMDSFLCSSVVLPGVTQQGCPASSQDAKAYQNCTLVEHKFYPITLQCSFAGPTVPFVIFLLLKVELKEI